MSDKVKNFIIKLRSLPEVQRKFIFFTIMAIIIMIAIFLGTMLTKKNIAQIGESLKSLNFPKMEISKPDFGKLELGGGNLNSEELMGALESLNFENTSESSNEVLNLKP